MNKIKLDIGSSYKSVSSSGLQPASEGRDIKEIVMGNDTEGIIESYYFPEYARPYIRQPSDEEMEIESENLFKNVISLIRLAIVDSSTNDCLKSP